MDFKNLTTTQAQALTKQLAGVIVQLDGLTARWGGSWECIRDNLYHVRYYPTANPLEGFRGFGLYVSFSESTQNWEVTDQSYEYKGPFDVRAEGADMESAMAGIVDQIQIQLCAWTNTLEQIKTQPNYVNDVLPGTWRRKQRNFYKKI